jgi:GntR family phosphonate transport system transcriptional regulator
MTVWQTIGDALRRDIDDGVVAPGGRLQSDAKLALRFGVNRHTVRRALSQLQEEGLVRSERGRGTFVVEDVLEFRLGQRTRFEENLLERRRIPTRRLLSALAMPAPASIAAPLQMPAGAAVLHVAVLNEADGLPLSLGYHYLPLARLPAAPERFARIPKGTPGTWSFTAIMRDLGVADFRRRQIRIRARPPSADEARQLKMSPSDHVLENEVTNVGLDTVPVKHARNCFPASRAEFVLEI